MRFAEYAVHDGLGLARLVRERDVTATELLEAAQARAAAVNPQINAIVRWMPAEAQSRAAAATAGPFGGVPFLLKDLFQEYAHCSSIFCWHFFPLFPKRKVDPGREDPAVRRRRSRSVGHGLSRACA